MSNTIYWIISFILAAVPIFIWLYILFKHKKGQIGMLIVVFSGGIFATLAVFGTQWLWGKFPEIDPVLWLESAIEDPAYYYVGFFVLVGIIEEIFKQAMVRYVDSKEILIKTVNDSLRFSLCAALGFAFAENVVYFNTVILDSNIREVIVTFVFRSLFTAAAHMIFSGIFGYFYGIAKFSIDITKQKKWEGKKYFGPHLIGRLFNMPFAQAYKEWRILQGLILAIVLHAIFNYMLQLNYIFPVIILVVLGFAYLMYLLKRKVGNLLLINDITEKKKSTMPKKDMDVVLELMGMWFEQNKYQDVLDICERLLKRDPDNNVVKMFQAKAQQKVKPGDPNVDALNTIAFYSKKQKEEGKVLTKEQEEKIHREAEEKRKQEETYKL